MIIMDMPPECPPGMSVFDVITIYSQHILNHSEFKGFSCFIQTPDNLKDQDLKGYPYFDFESARKQNSAESESLQSAGISDTEFYLTILLGAITFIAFAIGFATGFIYLE